MENWKDQWRRLSLINMWTWQLAVHNSQYYSIELLLSIHMKNKKNEKLPSRSRDYGLEVNEQTSHVKLIYFCFFVSLFSFPFFPFFGVTHANKILAHKQHEASTWVWINTRIMLGPLEDLRRKTHILHTAWKYPM